MENSISVKDLCIPDSFVLAHSAIDTVSMYSSNWVIVGQLIWKAS